MRLFNISVKNFMSLRSFHLDELDSHANFIVGPNGVGKTSIYRALRVLRDSLERMPGIGTTHDLQSLRTREITAEGVEIAIGVEFDTAWEQELLVAYLCAALTHPEDLRSALPRVEPQSTPAESGMDAYANWIVDILRSDAIPFLFRGELRLHFWHEVRDRLRVTYSFEYKGESVSIMVGFGASDYALFTLGSPPSALLGNPPAEQSLLDFMKQQGVYPAVRDILLNRPTDTHLPDTFEIAPLFRWLGEQKAVMLAKHVSSSQVPYPPAHRRLSELSGEPISDVHQLIPFAHVLHMLLDQSMVFTNNLRTPPATPRFYPWEEALDKHSSAGDEGYIPLQLFRLKNGDYASRMKYSRIQQSFSSLVSDPICFDVVAVPLILPERSQESAHPALKVDVVVTDQQGEIPIASHGAGVWEALVLASLLDDSQGRVILLDEPASNLHPRLQHSFARMLEGDQGQFARGQFLIVTHSQHLLPTRAQRLSTVRRLSNSSGDAQAFRLRTTPNSFLDKLEKELSMSSDMAGLLFSSGVILVEGATEALAIQEWFPQLPRHQGRTIEDLNIALYPVNGKQNFPLYIQFLAEFGLPWAVICDADALDLSERHDLWRKLVDLRMLNAVPGEQPFENLKHIASSCGVFTANASLEERSFEGIPAIKRFLHEHEASLPDSKPRRVRYIAQNLPCPDVIERTIDEAMRWLANTAAHVATQ